MASQKGGNIFGMSFSDASESPLNMFAILALFISSLIIVALGIYYIIIYKRAKGEISKKVQTLGIINVTVGVIALLFSAIAFYYS